MTIREIGTLENFRFMATEFIDGETLRQHLRWGIKLSEILETASALAAAPAVGIIHRDIEFGKNHGAARRLNEGVGFCSGKVGRAEGFVN